MRIFQSIVFAFSIIISLLVTGLSAAPEKNPQDNYPMHLDGGKTIAIQQDFKLCFNEKNSLLSREIELKSSSVNRPGRCLVFGNTVFLPDKDFCAAVSEKGEIFLFGGAFFLRNGTLLYEFPPAEKAADFENVFPAERVILLGEQKLLVKTKNLTFVFDIESGTAKTAGAAFGYLKLLR
ncbi:MAG: hypothetical protein IJ306_09185 [Oscillospiraceae bacterium]|nr:hypothetical protein [Oscillospiraceae bacterium]